jgi:glycogen debranching enzyme
MRRFHHLSKDQLMTDPFRSVDPWQVTDVLDQLRTGEGVQASNDQLFRGATFGRDSLQVALDLVPWYPALVERILLFLAHYQGLHHDPRSEEEPGRIHHEARKCYDGPLLLDESVRSVMRDVSTRFGLDASGGEFVYYGAIDPTCQFLRVLMALYRHHPGRRCVLDQPLRHRTGVTTTLRESAARALEWIRQRIRHSDVGLLEYKRTNPQGIENQVLRDSVAAYFHEDGRSVNHDAPIASIEVQGLAWAALNDAAELLLDDSARQVADNLRERTLRLFYLNHEARFASAIDRDAAGRPRHVRSLTSLPAELLEVGFFDGLEDEPELVAAAVAPIFSPQFLTPAGVRSVSAAHANLFDYWTYHGPATVWIVSTNIIARGLHRCGLWSAALELQRRLLWATHEVGYAEFIYTDPRTDSFIFNISDRPGDGDEVVGTNRPEAPQAWSVSAAIRSSRAAHPKVIEGRWRKELCHALLDGLPTSQPQSRRAWVNTSEGQRREAALRAAWGAASTSSRRSR